MTTFTILPGDAIFPASAPLDSCSRCGGALGAVVTCAKWPATGETEARYCAKCASK